MGFNQLAIIALLGIAIGTAWCGSDLDPRIYWTESRGFLQSKWTQIRAAFGGDELLLGIFGTFLLTELIYWFLNTLLMIPDVTGKPKFLLKYRTQQGVNEPVDPLRLRSALKVVVLNQIFVGLPAAAILFFSMRWRGCEFGPELPEFQTAFGQLLLMAMIEEVGFYYSHRLLHYGAFYKRIHKIHHEWTAPIGFISIYCHPLEHFLSNLFPPMLGIVAVRAHIFTAWIWFALILISTTINHSGYHFPLLASPELHDYHHLKFNQNYGVLGILDWLHGTDAQFRAAVQFKRNHILLSSRSMREIYPDEKIN